VIVGLQPALGAPDDRGQIVGVAVLPGGRTGVWPRVRKAVLWEDGGVAVLPGFALPGFAAAADINDAGDVVGYGARDRRAVPLLWRDAQLTTLPVLPCDDCNQDLERAVAISESGLIAGIGEAPPLGRAHAVVWDARARSGHPSVRDLGTLGGSSSHPSAISGHGQVIGNSEINEAGIVSAFVWESGSITRLGALPGGTRSRATAINDSDQIVGVANAHTKPHAVLWTKTGS
jgi:probable HAF family extracellular repeat protein